MIKPRVQQLLTAILPDLGFPLYKEVLLEYPKNPEYGDYATNIAFLLAKQLKEAPHHIAQEMCVKLTSVPQFQGIQFTSLNGFVNMRFSDAYLWQEFSRLFHEKPQFPKTQDAILLEYVSANPTGPLHIGHGRWAVIGSVLEAILRFTGHRVDTEYYINDTGTQVEHFYKSIDAVKKGQPIPEGGYHGAYMYELSGSRDNPLMLNVTRQKEALERLGITFTTWFSETLLHQEGRIEESIALLEGKNLVYTQDNALWFRSTAYGDSKDRVLRKADGRYTYFAVDVAYHRDKVLRGHTRLINIWGADHHGYVARVEAALQALFEQEPPKRPEFKVIVGQLVSLFRNGEPVRMSKRTGDLITLDEVVDEIGPDATRFFLIEKSPDTHLEFDLELAKKKSSDNPVYYIQYAHARMCSILEKLDAREEVSPVLLSEPLHPYERKLIYSCVQFYDTVWDAANALAPYWIAQYCLALARDFHLFYEQCPILKVDEPQKQKRLFILSQTRNVLSQALSLLGISAPKKM